jgi:hypothetical protein
MKNLSPLARVDGIVVQEIKDEILVCDTKSNQVFCLNQTAGEVWKLCDGKTDAKEISRILSRKFRAEFTEEMVLFSLDELSKENLLAKKLSGEKLYFGVSRREALKRVGLASMVALPIITAVTMPTAAQAQSACPDPLGFDPIPNGCPCGDCSFCDSGCCFNGVCSANNVCNTPATCGATLNCPAPFVCCDMFGTNVNNDSTCSVCGC